MAVPYRVLRLGHLSFIQVRFSIPLPCKIVLVLAPSDTRHKMDNIPFVSPGFDPILKRHPFTFVRWIAAHSIHHHGVGTVINGRSPFSRSLKGRLYLFYTTLG